MNPMPKQAVNSEPPRVNVIAEGTTFEGTVAAACDIRISGTVTGTLKGSARVVVSAGAAVEGDLHAAEATIAGTVKGKIMVKDRLMLKGSAQVEGTIRTARLIVEEGAVFNGECMMDGAGQSLGPKVEITVSASDAEMDGATPAAWRFR